jgi:hypothetical protein
MEDLIPPNRRALEEALALSEEVLRNIELSELPLANIALKASRLARLLNEYKFQKIMEYEASGYPGTPEGVHPDIFALAILAGRGFKEKDAKTGELKDLIYRSSIAELEHDTRIAEAALDAARDRDVAISSSNPYQHVQPPIGNFLERKRIMDNAATASRRLSARRSFIYSYVLSKHYELKYSGIADDIFSRTRERVNEVIGALVPEAVQKLSAVHDNLRSENPEDWSNAVHSCRRILQDLADVLFPAQEDRIKEINGKQRTIKLGKDNYINRLSAFVEDNSDSGRFQGIVGSHLGFLGDRLDSVFQAAQKGSHEHIISKEEADRYVIYTYLVVGDLLSLRKAI